MPKPKVCSRGNDRHLQLDKSHTLSVYSRLSDTSRLLFFQSIFIASVMCAEVSLGDKLQLIILSWTAASQINLSLLRQPQTHSVILITFSNEPYLLSATRCSV